VSLVMVEVEEVLEFLNTWKTKRQLSEKFNLSNTESFNLIRWLVKGRKVESWQLKKTGVRNRMWYYRTKKEKIKKELKRD